MFYGDDLAKYDALTLYVCAPYGHYEVELDIFGGGGKPISGDIGVKVYQGQCQVCYKDDRICLCVPCGLYVIQ